MLADRCQAADPAEIVSNVPVARLYGAVAQAKRRSVLPVAASDDERVALTAFVTHTVLAGGNAVCIRLPLSTLLLAVLWRQERLRAAAVMGTDVYVGALRRARSHPAAVEAKTDMDPSTDR